MDASSAFTVGKTVSFAGDPLTLDAHRRAVAGYAQARVSVFDRAFVSVRVRGAG